MELPYNAFEICTSEGNLKLLMTAVYEGSPESLKRGGVNADFRIEIDINGITADLKCYISVGNLYSFYNDLLKCYENLRGEAVLKDYSEKLTIIVFAFSITGGCEIYGCVHSDSYSKNKVEFGLECDQTYILPILYSLKRLFDELAKIQGYYDFPY